MNELAREEGFPREIADGIWWINQCTGVRNSGKEFHFHMSMYLVIGEEKTLVVDTSIPSMYESIGPQLLEALGGRTLDYLFITHPEPPHSSGLTRLVEMFPDVKIVGDTREYHLYFPHVERNLEWHIAGEKLDLGGRTVTFLDAPMRDLSGTLWGYDDKEQALFVCDGFSFIHEEQLLADDGSPALANFDIDDPIHRPGECWLLSSEITGGVTVGRGTYVLTRAMYSSRYVSDVVIFEEVDRMLDEYPAKIIAPSHGNVIDEVDVVRPIIREMHRLAYTSEGKAF